MKKVAFLGIALLLSASTALAYNNDRAGYSLNNKTPDLVMESSKLYGYMNLADEAVHTVSAFTAAEVETALEEEFSTAYFNEAYRKLSILDKNELDKSMLELPLLDLERYAKLDNMDKSLLENNFSKQFKEKLKPVIRLDKLSGRNVITLQLCYKHANDIVNTYISLLSANDMLYILCSGSNSALPVAEVKLDPKDAKNTLTDEKDKPVFEAMDISKLDPVLAKALWRSHTKHLKLFKTTIPVTTDKAKYQLSYTDAYAGKTIALPDDWCYFQYNHTNKLNPGVLSISLPTTTLSEIASAWADDDIFILTKSNLKEAALTKKLGGDALDKLQQLLITGSVKVDKDRDLQNMLANPLASKIQADLFLGDGLRHLKRVGDGYLVLKDYKYSTDFTQNKGMVDIYGAVKVLDKYDFDGKIKVMARPNLLSGTFLVNKEGVDADSKVQNIYNQWGL